MVDSVGILRSREWWRGCRRSRLQEVTIGQREHAGDARAIEVGGCVIGLIPLLSFGNDGSLLCSRYSLLSGRPGANWR